MSGSESPKLFKRFLDLKKWVFSVLICLPTSFFALLILFLLAYNSFYVFCFHIPFLSNSPPEPANFSSADISGDSATKLTPTHVSISSPSTKPKISSSVMYAVKEENAPMFLNNPRNSFLPTSKMLIQRPRRLRKHKRKLKSIPPETKTSLFSTRIKDFFAGNSSSPCKVKFFMTWISSKPFGNRELLAVESLFKSHPNACLAVVSKSLDSENGIRILNPFTEMGFRVMAVSPDFEYLFKNTPAEAWYGELRKGNVNAGGISLGQNLSNLLRLALLYKYGGIYLDTDVILLKSLSNLRNVIGAQTTDPTTGNWSRLNNAVLVFDKNHPLLFKFIQEFALTFDGNKWGHNGPYLVSRVVSRISSDQNATNPGFNFTVLTPSAFYPVNWIRIRSLFHGPRDDLHSRWLHKKLRHLCDQSFAVHLWNSQSKNLKVEKGSIIDHFMSDFSVFSNSSSSSVVNID